ncbi:GTP-dependent dephospho-CoA kinase family protein [Candidatus Hecatella orcuttiae]|uniref:GTP-dependent dephospho-CoA kinase family protein n=1 Tax=Candidatus Hecatella orcuttiae TaxID=1935119 RepID=UPI002867F878|nr:GTP-dependent dephospho-CoA kinase family protein [Candidatus Hecatella orcuttiae]
MEEGRVKRKLLLPNLRSKLKKPLGELLKEAEASVEKRLRKKLEQLKPPKLVAVGDQTSAALERMGIKADLYIVDGKVERRKTSELKLYPSKVLRVENPAGVLTEAALVAVREALESEEAGVILVEGEEDLLTLPAILYAPKESLVLYGQPGEGVVAVRVTAERKKFAEKIISRMEEVE